MKIEYCRVGSNEQKFMHNALKKAGYEKIFGNIVSGAKESRPELDKETSLETPKLSLSSIQSDRT